jgi:hypothetical protein
MRSTVVLAGDCPQDGDRLGQHVQGEVDPRLLSPFFRPGVNIMKPFSFITPRLHETQDRTPIAQNRMGR